MAANRRRPVSGMLILRGTTSRKPGTTDDVATGQPIRILAEVSRGTVSFSRGNSRFLDRAASSAGHGGRYDAARSFRAALAWSSTTPGGRAGRAGEGLGGQGVSELADHADADRTHRGRQDV